MLNCKSVYEQKDTDNMPEEISHETQNTEKITQGVGWDYDLVRMTEHSPTCPICAMYQGRVYAVTPEAANGKYKLKDGTILKFPYLYETAFSNGKNCIHPNCRHCISILPAQAYTSDELLAFSRKSTAPFDDTRSDEEKLRYDSLQAKSAIQNEQRKMYENIKKTLPDDAPKNFSGFVRMDTAKSVKYKLLMRNYQEKSNHTFCVNDGITFETIFKIMEEKNYTSEEVLYVLKKLYEAKLILTDNTTSENTTESSVVYEITYEGRHFLHRIKSKIIWDNIKDNFSPSVEDVKLSAISDFATNLINNYSL